MKPVDFPDSNKRMLAPAGSEAWCDDLPVWSGHDQDGQRVVVSCWELSDEDIENLIKTRSLWLMIYGVSMPPIAPLSVCPLTHQ